MSISFFSPYDKWEQISRGEKVFCSYLYHTIHGHEREFISWLNDKPSIRNKDIIFFEEELNDNWDIGFEVCFYRDYLNKVRNTSARKTIYPPQRTFDLCLFSEKRILIIEAKAHQKFKLTDMGMYLKDKQLVQSVLDKDIKVDLIALASSIYLKRIKDTDYIEALKKFDGFISWNELYQHYNVDMFKFADECFEN